MKRWPTLAPKVSMQPGKPGGWDSAIWKKNTTRHQAGRIFFFSRDMNEGKPIPAPLARRPRNEPKDGTRAPYLPRRLKNSTWRSRF